MIQEKRRKKIKIVWKNVAKIQRKSYCKCPFIKKVEENLDKFTVLKMHFSIFFVFRKVL